MRATEQYSEIVTQNNIKNLERQPGQWHNAITPTNQEENQWKT